MFNNIPEKIKKRMEFLENLDEQSKSRGPFNEILWQIPRKTAKFISLIAASVPNGNMLEIGSGGGYSALWIGLACKIHDRKLITFEMDPYKASIANQSFITTHMEETIKLVEGDALDYIRDFKEISFCFLDTEDKDIYLECYDIVVSNMISGGFFVADNAVSHKYELQNMIDYVFKDERVDAIIVPIGKGELVCRKY